MTKQEHEPALIVNIDGEEKKISFEELTISNNLTLEALVRILAKKGIITTDEFVKQLEEIEKERFRRSE